MIQQFQAILKLWDFPKAAERWLGIGAPYSGYNIMGRL
jgi:hypothetical protein